MRRSRRAPVRDTACQEAVRLSRASPPFALSAIQHRSRAHFSRVPALRIRASQLPSDLFRERLTDRPKRLTAPAVRTFRRLLEAQPVFLEPSSGKAVTIALSKGSRQEHRARTSPAYSPARF